MSTILQSIRLKFLFNTFLALSLFFVIGAATSFAAENDYTVSGGNPASLPTVGASSVALPTLTITDTAGDDFGNDPENIVIAINTTNYNNVVFDPSIAAGALTIAGSCGYTGANALTYSSDRQSVTVPITGGTSCANTETITIAGLKIFSRFTATAPGANALVNVDNPLSDGGTLLPVSTSSTIDLASTVGDAAGAVVLQAGANRVVGLNGTTTVTLTLGYILANTDTVVFTMPAWISVTNGAFTGETDTFSGAGGFDCVGVSATRVITCTANGVVGLVDATDTAETATIVFASGDVLSNYVATGTNAITDLAVNFVNAAEGGSGQDISSDATVTISDTSVGTLTSTSLTPASTANATLSAYTIAFTTVGTTMATNAKIVVIFPTGYDLTGMDGSATNLSGLDGTWAVSVSGQTLTLTQSGGTTITPGAKSLTVANVRNPATEGATGTFTLTTTTSASANIQTATPAAVTVSVGSSSVSSSFDDLSNISVTDNPDGEGVLITWEETGDDDTTFVQILRGVDPFPVDGTPYATVAAGLEEYVDTDVEVGDVVTYQLRPTDGNDTGDLTAEVTLTVGSGETSTSTDDEDDTTDDTSDDTTDDSNDDTSDDDTSDDSSDDDSSDDSVTFSDTDGHWAAAAIEVAVTEGWVEGNPDGSFDPDGNLNRAQAAAMLWRVLGMGEASDAEEDPFTDVDMGEWYASYIAGLEGLDLVDGNPDGTYEPAEEMNRAEFLQLAVNVYLYLHEDMEDDADALMDGEATDAYEDLDTAAWYEGAVTVATAWGFVQGSACEGGMCFNAGNTITRAEATQILYNMFADAM